MTLGVMQPAYPRPMYERQIWLRDAVCRNSRRNWYSLSPSERFSGFGRRMRAGMASSISASREAAPIAFSIASRSSASGPMWRLSNDSKSNTMSGPMAKACATSRGHLYEVFVLRGVEERAGFTGAGQLDDDHPVAVRILVHCLGLVLERGVDLDDFTGDRRVQLRDGLDRFDGPEGLPLLQLGADFRQLDVHHVAKLLLRIVGDPDLAPVAGELDPLVVFGVFEAG